MGITPRTFSMASLYPDPAALGDHPFASWMSARETSLPVKLTMTHGKLALKTAIDGEEQC